MNDKFRILCLQGQAGCVFKRYPPSAMSMENQLRPGIKRMSHPSLLNRSCSFSDLFSARQIMTSAERSDTSGTANNNITLDVVFLWWLRLQLENLHCPRNRRAMGMEVDRG